MSATDPYTAPAATAPEDRTDPRFQVIHPCPRGLIVFLGFGAVLLGILSLRAYFMELRTLSLTGAVFFNQIAATLNLVFQNFRASRRIRGYPLVLGGQALYGGVAAWGTGRGAIRGVLYATHDALCFFQHSGGWDAGELTSLPIQEIQRLAVRRRFGLFRVYLDVCRRSGSVTTYTVTQPRLWKNAINHIRREISAASASLPLR